MKDLIAKLQLDANCVLGAIWMHIDAQAARIAELEAENTNLRYELNAALSGGTVSCPSSAALQAPVREVPEGWKLTRCEDGMIIVSKNKIGGYAAWKDDSNIASSILYHFADEFLATVPAAPVQQEGDHA